MSATKQLSIPVGFQWKHVESGKEWVVIGLRPGGICEVYRVGRHVSGQTQTRILRASIEAGDLVQVETSEAARAILRRLNGCDHAA